MTKAKRPRKTKSKTLFYDLFIGEYVDIVSKYNIKITEEAENGVMIQESPLVFSGYVIDIDDLFIYLGPEAFAVSQAVKKDEFISICVTERPQQSAENVVKMKEDKNLN